MKTITVALVVLAVGCSDVDSVNEVDAGCGDDASVVDVAVACAEKDGVCE